MTWQQLLVFTFAFGTDLLACAYVAAVSRKLLLAALTYHWLNDLLSHIDWSMMINDPSLIMWSFWGQGLGGTLGTLVGLGYLARLQHELFPRQDTDKRI